MTRLLFSIILSAPIEVEVTSMVVYGIVEIKFVSSSTYAIAFF